MNKQLAITFFIFIFILIFNINISLAEETSEIDKNLISDIVRVFKEETDKWYDKVKAGATDLFLLIILFEILWTSLQAAMKQMTMQDFFYNFFMITMSACFFFAVINHYQEWSQAIILGLQKFAGTLTPIYSNTDNPFIVASKFFELIDKKIEGLGILSDAGLVFGLIIAGFIMTVCFALITAKMIVIKCEVMVGALGSLLLIPLGASQMFREIAINAIRYIFAVGFKLFTMQLIIAVGYGFIDKLLIDFSVTTYNVFMVISFALILLCLIFTLPDTIASLVSSAHGTAGNMLQALNTVSNTATAGAAGAMAIASAPGKAIMTGYDTSRAASGAYQLSKSAAGGGIWNSAKNIASTNMGIRDQAKMNKSSIGMEFINAHNAMKKINSKQP